MGTNNLLQRLVWMHQNSAFICHEAQPTPGKISINNIRHWHKQYTQKSVVYLHKQINLPKLWQSSRQNLNELQEKILSFAKTKWVVLSMDDCITHKSLPSSPTNNGYRDLRRVTVPDPNHSQKAIVGTKLSQWLRITASTNRKLGQSDLRPPKNLI